MQSFYPERFEREMGCTEVEWQRALPAAMGDAPWRQASGALHADIGTGQLRITWREGAPRAIALMRMPRMHVAFEFTGLDERQRFAFMQRFDLYMQRGGG
jgi:hypothetical protein